MQIKMLDPKSIHLKELSAFWDREDELTIL